METRVDRVRTAVLKYLGIVCSVEVLTNMIRKETAGKEAMYMCRQRLAWMGVWWGD